MKVSITFTTQLMSIHTTKVTEFSIEISDSLIFSQICHGETFLKKGCNVMNWPGCPAITFYHSYTSAIS